jgi:hypothetical protein
LNLLNNDILTLPVSPIVSMGVLNVSLSRSKKDFVIFNFRNFNYLLTPGSLKIPVQSGQNSQTIRERFRLPKGRLSPNIDR